MSEEWNHPTLSDAEKAQIASHNLSSAQTLITIALISSPVSLIIGGVLLSSVALICALVAQTKVRTALTMMDEPTFMATRLRSQTRIAMLVSLCATVANVVYVVLMFPVLMEFMQSGNMQQLMDSIGAAQQGSSSSASTSVWG